MTEGAASADDFLASGLAALGIEADEVDLAVMGAVHQLLWEPLLGLLALDTAEFAPERHLDLSRAPR